MIGDAERPHCSIARTSPIALNSANSRPLMCKEKRGGRKAAAFVSSTADLMR
jgi:hypothetical protein